METGGTWGEGRCGKMWSAGLRTGAHLTSGSTRRAPNAASVSERAAVRDARDGGDAAVGRRKAKLEGRAPGRQEDRTGARRPLDGGEASGKGGSIRCYGTRGQLDEIRRRAALAGLPASAFLRNLALGAPIRCAYDLEAARGLLALEARLERVEERLGRIAERGGGSPDYVGATVAEVRRLAAAMRILADRA